MARHPSLPLKRGHGLIDRSDPGRVERPLIGLSSSPLATSAACAAALTGRWGKRDDSAAPTWPGMSGRSAARAGRRYEPDDGGVAHG